ncbi:plastocyanin/azurin family copper-binding protein [Halegenticoccus tardaugens]|uniref:plastocyanin/azurin family copper-binding protein n=1 Tax=Halegenticoccus tardaugens TaxID=2071624 RepID=UPI00100C0378|nr:plastocyanin/azurin family copper-binding protein [Halegenticoccus tardaugens]
MNRRDFLRTAGGSAAVAASAGTAAAQEDGGGGDGGGGGGGGSEEVIVGPGGDLSFDPEELEVAPGTTVTFVWESDGHNVVPSEGDWGHENIENSGFEYEHTFEEEAEYEYVCTPHESAGMVGTLVVTQNPSTGEGGPGEKELHELGVPIQAHWVGASTILGIVVTIIYTFYILKYGESPNTGNTGGRS